MDVLLAIWQVLLFIAKSIGKTVGVLASGIKGLWMALHVLLYNVVAANPLVISWVLQAALTVLLIYLLCRLIFPLKVALTQDKAKKAQMTASKIIFGIGILFLVICVFTNTQM